MVYYGTRLSENISRREPEGYLLCLNVPVARSGTQQYLAEELGLPGSGGWIPVFRPEEEVFSRECIASFEGMPVTNDHPPEGVTLENIRRLQKGHAHNVRRGSGDEKDLLLADLMITDRELIDAILGGKREISCGYTYELSEEDGRFVQRKIRGNHVAVVDAGRAGHRVSIRDTRPEAGPESPVSQPTERSTPMKKKSIARVLARMARDGDTESVAEILEEMLSPEEEKAEAAGPDPEEATEETKEEEAVAEITVPETAQITIGSDTAAAILERLDRLIALLGAAAEALPEPPAEPAGDGDPLIEEMTEAVEEAMEAMAAAGEAGAEPADVQELLEELEEPVSSVLEPEEDAEEDPVCTADALRAALRAVRPALARMPKKQRTKVCAEIAGRVRSGAAMDSRGGGSVYAALARKGKARETADPAELGRRIMAARNVNQRKYAP